MTSWEIGEIQSVVRASTTSTKRFLFCNNVWNVSPLGFKITAIFFLVRKVSAFSGDKWKWATFLQVNRTEIICHPTPYSRARVFSATLLSKSSCTCAKILFFFSGRESRTSITSGVRLLSTGAWRKKRGKERNVDATPLLSFCLFRLSFISSRLLPRGYLKRKDSGAQWRITHCPPTAQLKLVS